MLFEKVECLAYTYKSGNLRDKLLKMTMYIYYKSGNLRDKLLKMTMYI